MARHWSAYVGGITERQARALDKMAEAHDLGDGMALLQEVSGSSRSGVGRMDRLTLARHVDECFARWGRDAAQLPASGTAAVTNTPVPAGLRQFTPWELADAAIGLFLEYRDQHGYDEAQARRAAASEVAEGAAVAADLGG